MTEEDKREYIETLAKDAQEGEIVDGGSMEANKGV